VALSHDMIDHADELGSELTKSFLHCDHHAELGESAPTHVQHNIYTCMYIPVLYGSSVQLLSTD